MAQKFIVTVNRQFGSLGRTIGRRAAQLLGVEVYDRDLIAKAANEIHLSVDEVKDIEEKANNSIDFWEYPLGNGTSQLQDDIYKAQKEFIESVAKEESCVMIGRCSDYILSGPHTIRIYIYAPSEDRYNVCVKKLGIKPKEAYEAMKQIDKARDAYHMRYSGYLPHDKAYVDLFINSSLLGVEGSAQLIKQLVELKVAQWEAEEAENSQNNN